LKSEDFCVFATKKKSLALHVYWTTNQKGKKNAWFWVFGGKGVFSLSFLAAPSLVLSLSFCLIGNHNLPFLPNSHFLSRQFTFKYFNDYFPKKREIALHRIFKLWIWLRGAKLLKQRLGCQFGCFGKYFGLVSSQNLFVGRIHMSS